MLTSGEILRQTSLAHDSIWTWCDQGIGVRRRRHGSGVAGRARAGRRKAERPLFDRLFGPSDQRPLRAGRSGPRRRARITRAISSCGSIGWKTRSGSSPARSSNCSSAISSSKASCGACRRTPSTASRSWARRERRARRRRGRPPVPAAPGRPERCREARRRVRSVAEPECARRAAAARHQRRDRHAPGRAREIRTRPARWRSRRALAER